MSLLLVMLRNPEVHITDTTPLMIAWIWLVAVFSLIGVMSFALSLMEGYWVIWAVLLLGSVVENNVWISRFGNYLLIVMIIWNGVLSIVHKEDPYV